MGISIVTRNYQITLPKDIRTLSNLKEGDQVIVDVDDKGRIILDVLKKSPVDDTFGIWKAEREGVEYVRALRKEWKSRSEELGID
jgi:AbrB family looped-hinge helix DNA binding protein